MFLGSICALATFAQSSAPQAKAHITLPTTTKQWTGDLDALLKHRVIRVGVPYSKTLYYTVKGVQYGTAYETGKEFEKYLNKKYPQANKHIKVLVIFFVMPRDKAYPSLKSGSIDVLIGGVAITTEREKLVDFTEPIVTGVNEIAVSAPGSPSFLPSMTSPGRLSTSASPQAIGNTWKV